MRTEEAGDRWKQSARENLEVGEQGARDCSWRQHLGCHWCSPWEPKGWQDCKGGGGEPVKGLGDPRLELQTSKGKSVWKLPLEDKTHEPQLPRTVHGSISLLRKPEVVHKKFLLPLSWRTELCYCICFSSNDKSIFFHFRAELWQGSLGSNSKQNGNACQPLVFFFNYRNAIG